MPCGYAINLGVTSKSFLPFFGSCLPVTRAPPSSYPPLSTCVVAVGSAVWQIAGMHASCATGTPSPSGGISPRTPCLERLEDVVPTCSTAGVPAETLRDERSVLRPPCGGREAGRGHGPAGPGPEQKLVPEATRSSIRRPGGRHLGTSLMWEGPGLGTGRLTVKRGPHVPVCEHACTTPPSLCHLVAR